MSTQLSTGGPTLVEQACLKVTGFRELYNQLERDISLSGRSLSTLKNYSRHIAQLALYFHQLPHQLAQDQVQDYLWMIHK